MTKRQACLLAQHRWPGYHAHATIRRTGEDRCEIEVLGTPGGSFEAHRGVGNTLEQALARLGCQRCNPEECILLVPNGDPCNDCWLKAPPPKHGGAP